MSVYENCWNSRCDFIPSYSVELKICCMLYAVRNLHLLLPVLRHHIGYLVDARLILISISGNPATFRIRNYSVSVTTGYEMAAKIVAWGNFTPSNRMFIIMSVKMQLIRSFCLTLLTWCSGSSVKTRRLGSLWNGCYRETFHHNRWSMLHCWKF